MSVCGAYRHSPGGRLTPGAPWDSQGRCRAPAVDGGLCIEHERAIFGQHPACECHGATDFLLRLEGGSLTLIHETCRRPLAIDDPFEEVIVEDVPVTLEFTNLGMSPDTPNGPAEHNGWWWTATQRSTP